jgi:hypothetical protein
MTQLHFDILGQAILSNPQEYMDYLEDLDEQHLDIFQIKEKNLPVRQAPFHFD